ncbi:argininosuccinate synthase [Eupeodes corollae]|uniref:argininosuccinate synthase n=1 Tax=Eupeodes corollae TaxID=290404 RepID=UPI002490A667|nr:argininosuccinate synthase [Eupeodes corollae]
MNTKDKVLLAYSGGLDTSCILKWLQEKGFEVICFIADVGQDEDFEAAKKKAFGCGAEEVIIKDVKEDFVENYIWPSIQMGLVYEERYLLGTSLARPCISVALVEAAKSRGAKYIAHGATGKGNDQVRFEMCAYALFPEVKIISPWRDDDFCKRFQGRLDLIKYAEQNGIPVSAKPSAPWSTDANIMHISYESGILEDPNQIAPNNLYEMTKDPKLAPSKPYRVKIHFQNGLPVKAEDMQSMKTFKKPIDILKFLNEVGGLYGIGRIDIVENRFVGLKSRGVYETPGGTILFSAHQDLEVFCLDREIYRTKSYLRDSMSVYVYNGFWFSPEAVFTRKCLELSQEHVNGEVIMELMPGYCKPLARKSAQELYNQELVSMDVHGGYVPADATGFIRINSVRSTEFARAYGKYKC